MLSQGTDHLISEVLVFSLFIRPNEIYCELLLYAHVELRSNSLMEDTFLAINAQPSH